MSWFKREEKKDKTLLKSVESGVRTGLAAPALGFVAGWAISSLGRGFTRRKRENREAREQPFEYRSSYDSGGENDPNRRD